MNLQIIIGKSLNFVDKNTCVRVTYVNDYHIDLPVYIIKDDVVYLAHKKNEWIVSDSKAFTVGFDFIIFKFNPISFSWSLVIISSSTIILSRLQILIVSSFTL